MTGGCSQIDELGKRRDGEPLPPCQHWRRESDPRCESRQVLRRLRVGDRRTLASMVGLGQPPCQDRPWMLGEQHRLPTSMFWLAIQATFAEVGVGSGSTD
jgi:hypothetical protein